MNWTDEQRATIETTGKSILVSAAAGSGKTTVLVERIKRLMIDEGTDIDRFLITTFTNAAAAEMRERLEKALREELKKPDADRTMLTRQLSKLPSASIGTFHSFAFDVVRQYFYLIDAEPGFSVADDVQIEIMKRQAVDNVFARRYEENSEAFRAFVLKYGGGRTDKSLRDNVLETCKTLGSIHNGIAWAREKASALGAEHPMEAIGGYQYMAGLILRGLEQALQQYQRAAGMCHDYGLANCYGVVCEDVENVEELISKAKRALDCPADQLRAAMEAFEGEIASFKAGTMAYAKDKADEDTKKRITKVRNGAKEQVDIIKNTVYGRSFDEWEEELRGLHEDTQYYVGILEDYYAELKSLKASENVIEFDDALHYAIDILGHEEAAAELRERYEYIFVDEYQDSNYLQEEIVGKIARPDNLFMVGDIKQCIYKFRLAEPEIFKARAEVYAAAGAADPDGTETGELLHISSNFRSKRNVTEPVNTVFEQMMDGYDENARLYCTAGDEHLGFPPRIHLIVNENFDEDAPDKNDAEGAVIAGIIRERLGTPVYDSKKQCVRPLQLGDFAVIVRNNKEVEDIERYLINEGIDAYGESGGKYFETVEVQVFINLLRIIENMRKDVPLISAMRSVVFGFTVQELAAIRIAFREGSYSDAVFAYAEADGAEADGLDQHLQEKIRAMIRTVDVWKEISRTVPLEDLMKEILYGTGYYDYCSGLPVGTQRISNLRLIADKAARFESMSSSGLYGFLRYVESMESSDKTDSEASVVSEGENVVRVMSVHKSKGLEFPVVIFANASKGTEKGDRSGRIKIHRNHGIGLPVVNREEHWHRSSLLQKMIVNTGANEAIEEEIRILYVALTRAKDGLEIVGTVKKMEQLEDGPNTKSFLQMLYKPLTEADEPGFAGAEVRIYDDAEALSQSHSRLRHTPEQLLELAGQFDNPELAALTEARLSYTYPYTSGAEIKPKYSVSELNRAGHEDGGFGQGGSGSIALPEAFDPDRSKRTGTLTAAERGTLMHLLMEKADFAEAVAFAGGARAYLQTVADRLLAEDILTAEEYDALSIDKAAGFFDAQVGQRAAEAARDGRLRKEKEFIFTMNMAEEADDAADPAAETIIQGVIDCFFEEEGGIVLIDYKNSYMGAGRTAEDIRQTYADQIDLYRKALEGATGKPVKEAYLFLFDTGEFVPMK
ncbi:MAG: UvrD-helicase domain-containing protein [Clostridia bacterium]|nr:UvrD-helicase domain-containing protein [Clostridia bacterium]